MKAIEKKPGQRGARLVAFVSVFCILFSLALVRNGALFGLEKGSGASAISYVGAQEIINTLEIGKDITGYGGPVPLDIYVTGGRIDSVVPLPNSESPKFFSRLASEGLTRAWDGLSLAEAEIADVDAVSGATFSSNAFIANVRAGAAYATGTKAATAGGVTASSVAALLVILAGAILPLFIKKPVYRLVQQLLNVAVLGFWAGTFIDYAMMLNFFSGAPRFTLSFVVSLLLVIVGLVYPLFKKPAYYCSWLCPFGSLQELTGKLCKKKWKMPARLIKGLDTFRRILWVLLLSLLYIGWGVSWIDYEVFTAFVPESASWIVISVGTVFVVLSLFVNRPFCRFVCPTGSLLKEV